jgi:hypothetical protein
MERSKCARGDFHVHCNTRFGVARGQPDVTFARYHVNDIPLPLHAKGLIPVAYDKVSGFHFHSSQRAYSTRRAQAQQGLSDLFVHLLLTFGAHALRGLRYLVCKCVCVRLSVTMFSATRQEISDTNGFITTLASFLKRYNY